MTSADLPAHKSDIRSAEKIVARGMPEIGPILESVLEWFQDYNWPVAKALEPVFIDMGPEIVPHIRKVLASNDDLWKYWIIVVVIPLLSQEAQKSLFQDVKRIAHQPLEGEIREEVSLEAKRYLRRLMT